MLSKLCTIYALRLVRARLLPRRPMTMVCRRIGERRSAGPENDEPRAVRVTASPFAVSERSAADLRAQAAVYRGLAETSHVLSVRAALAELADRYDALADQGEHKQFGGGRVGDEQ